MKSDVLTTTLLLALLLLVSLPISTLGLPKIWWHKQTEQPDARHHLKSPSSETTRLVGLVLLSQAPNSPPSPTGLLPWLPIIPKLPNIPGLPNIPRFPNIPGLPNLPSFPPLPGLPDLPNLPRLPPLPGLPSLPGLPPLPPYQSKIMSVEMEKCLKKDGSKTTEKCFSQIFSSFAKNDFALDKECCDIVLKMDKKCNRHVQMLLKSRFFVPFLQYSCNI